VVASHGESKLSGCPWWRSAADQGLLGPNAVEGETPRSGAGAEWGKTGGKLSGCGAGVPGGGPEVSVSGVNDFPVFELIFPAEKKQILLKAALMLATAEEMFFVQG